MSGEMNYQSLAAKIFTRGLRKFSNLHKGQTCYIFGNGPSVKWFDLSEFSDHPAICCGMIPFHKDFSKLNVKYVAMVEPWLFAPKFFHSKELEGFHRIGEEYKKLIKRTPEKEYFVSLSNSLSISGANINYVYYGLPEERGVIDEMLRRVNLFAGSFHATLTLAYYLGFSEIYLVGFDGWTIQPGRAMRWYEFGEPPFFDVTNLAHDFLEIIKQQANIYTISLDGKSENVKNISYQDYTGKRPFYKENDEILSEYYLEILASCVGCKIYPDKII